ncbi:MAG: PIG-L family deacetylase [Flammeovirgaceae bacterium]|nr:MAG: PIG-L family deacetylase [Flammeovirgaceae bacterium]
MRFLRIIVLAILPVLVYSQSRQPDASQIKLKLKKLNFLGSVLYVAAHPDDENTRVIAYLANERLATTAYLSMTRGDGGQNLIGPEIRDELGVIRTQELLAARRIDGGQQFFTRANDFGFSKNVNETLAIWGKEEILSDVVRVFRQFQPDVVLNRFPPNERAGHGHHTASAVLSLEAFDLAGSSAAFPDQLKSLPVWQPKRIYMNTGRFFNNTINENTPGVTVLNVGGYNALLGQSYAEMAATSRSQHKSQGFGSPGRRGDANEFFELAKGEPATKDIFEGINTTWTRVKGGEKIIPLIDKAVKDFNPEQPYLIVNQLLQIRKAIGNLEHGIWKTRKLDEVNQLIQDCLGLFAEVTTNQYWIAPGESLVASFEIINRSAAEVKLATARGNGLTYDTLVNTVLKNNSPLLFKTRRSITTAEYSDPYWLREPHSQGLFTVPDPNMIGKPENDRPLFVTLDFTVNGEPLTIRAPLVYKWTDPVKGELYRPVEVVPPVFVTVQNGAWIFSTPAPLEIGVGIKSARDGTQTGLLKIKLPDGWRAEPQSVPFQLTKRNEEQTKSFKVYPPESESKGKLNAVAEINGKEYNLFVRTINYDHIPIQTLLPKAEVPVVRIDLKKEGRVIGYIRGAGDDVPSALRNMGYEVWEMKNEEVTAENLKRVDAVVLGVRAINTNERIRFMMETLLKYVEQGGTMVVQYNTSTDLETDKYSPYPLTISRDRVTEEDAVVRILKPDHPVLNYPNKITQRDFDGWVQERGLYFPNKWDERYEAVLSMNDKGEEPKNGSLLVAKFGNGYYVYTGLSFFRELPEGVPGAYKFFANLVSLGKKTEVTSPTPPVKPKGKSRSK